jgi:threonylcarbamoyladenosine tRNA methylthiotransferase MtaB
MPEERPTVALLTLGCKLNQADSESIARRLGADGVRVVDRPVRGADAFVVNSCSVTHVADRKARHMVRLARRLSPDAQVILTGCYAEIAPADIASTTGADLVVGTAGKAAIPDRLLARLRSRGDPAGGCISPVRDGLRTRAFVKMQEGCDELCAYCIVPYTRGRERSVAIDKVVEEVHARESEGVLEVVLTGTQLGNYGRDLGWPETGPRPLLEALLERTSIPRIRLSSLQAQDISSELLRLWREPRLCPHFHLPLQSGADDVLQAMRRRYTVRRYLEAVELIREQVEDAAITADVIAGFPGETEGQFRETLDVCRRSGFAAMHCFPYSRRPGTAASKIAAYLRPPVRRERLERLLELGSECSQAFRRRFLGRTANVLWEQKKEGQWQGLTANYIRAYTSADGDLANRINATRLVSLEGEGMAGAPDRVTAEIG